MAEAINNDPVDKTVGWYTAPTERGTLSLVYSCLLTIFACTWTVLHLNVPGHEDSTATRFLRKLKWMAITILLPEFVFSKSVCELRLALKDYREFRETLATIETDRITWETPNPYGGMTGLRRSWKVNDKESKVVQALYRLMGLGLWESASKDKPCNDQSVTTTSATIEESKTLTKLPTHPESSRGDSNEQDPTIDNTNTQDPRPEVVVIPSSQDPENSDKDKTQTRWREQPQFWTLTHSYLANMGGLAYWHTAFSPFVLTGSKLSRHYEWRNVDHPLKGFSLQMEDIADKSKADWLLKSLSVLQISSLVLTVIARGVAGLPITQLEIATLAFSIFAIATFAVNWWKPKDISQPIWIPHITRGFDCSEDHEQDPENNTGVFNYTQPFMQRLLSPHRARRRERRIQDLLRVPNDMVDMEGEVPLIVILMAISALIFGGLHCSAWNFEFPTRTELILWRITSISSSLVPFASLLASLTLTYFATSYTIGRKVSAVRSEMECLRAWPDGYLDMITDPFFLKPVVKLRPGFSISRQQETHFFLMAILLRPAGIHRFDKIPEDEEIQRARDSEQKSGLYRTARSMELFANRFAHFRGLLKNLNEGIRWSGESVDLDFSISTLFIYDKELEIWKDFENSYVKRIAPVMGKEHSESTAVGDLMSGLGRLRERFHRFDKTREQCTRASRIVTIGGGILYITARLILLALLFSPLRSAPIGVYQNTPWTRFIPSFS
ncbi:hypothetical protein PFICI_03586 [Pestalotiopsis fici W106-1]|uniref:Uncharacterized protein n=1 Tax=Pestalotiopsis fici (strain W106-1 / CGMCC3.15140) TaxID=1229662 RepID=W3XJY6_PESFW|nr:uncharacterized protein PFICI_03586 [Pestalotiopsis fici W106-1]ETS85561.1 hypothetical protein PFICI_03586 [Pestalotiopsis fici W106-1]